MSGGESGPPDRIVQGSIACYNSSDFLRISVVELNLASPRVRQYELVMILSPEATEEEVTAAVEKIDGLITSQGGEVSDHQNWGLRRFAYPIKKFLEGNYVLTRFELEAQEIIELDRSLKTSGDILRHLLTGLAVRSSTSSERRPKESIP